MGGKLLNGKRFTTEEGRLLWEDLKPILQEYFKLTYKTRSVLEKQDHGDMDIVVSDPETSNWKEKLSSQLNCKIHSNGNVHSFLFKEVQIDLIHITGFFSSRGFTDGDEIKWAYEYFCDNDFGNLVGRIARHLGFTFGSQGFTYTVYHEEGNYKKEILVSLDQVTVYRFLGYTGTRPWSFYTFKDMFEWVTSSCLFDPTIYFLENRNHEGRHRDKKRPNYTKFLQFLSEKYPGCEEWSFNKVNKEVHLQRAYKQWPWLKAKIDKAREEAELIVAKKRAFNGNLITSVLCIAGKELGEFIKNHKHLFDKHFKEDFETRIRLLKSWYSDWKNNE